MDISNPELSDLIIKCSDEQYAMIKPLLKDAFSDIYTDEEKEQFIKDFDNSRKQFHVKSLQNSIKRIHKVIDKAAKEMGGPVLFNVLYDQNCDLKPIDESLLGRGNT